MSQTPPQQYCLRWNNYQNNLTNVFDQLLQTETFVDVTLACDGNSVKAHKMVLSACSPFFQTLLFDNPCKHPIVIFKDIGWDELKSVVEFMYRGEINVSQEQLAPLLKVAEMLKIRGLADVTRGSSASGSGESENHDEKVSPRRNSSASRQPPNPANFMSTSNQDSEPISPVHSNGHLTPNSGSLQRRKRRKMLTPERTPSPLEDGLDDHDSRNGDWNREHPPPKQLTFDLSSTGEDLSLKKISHDRNCSENSLGRGSTPKPAKIPNPLSAATMRMSSLGNSGSNNTGVSLCPLGPGNTSQSIPTSISSELDLKPGIVEMIREEERAKMLESSHGWLGTTIASNLSDSYQYQIQNLWQKCWNQNQGGVAVGQAIRFRERGPLKSWRPETMAEAIFAVLRDGLSLSQAARSFEIPYPTFVLYANRVHNMLGPSADGCSGTDLMSDTRPKGRGRPQRILLGSWPEDHIRGVIRAVVFRDSAGGKDDFPIIFNRETGLCLPQLPGVSSAQNGLDMALFSNFGNPFEKNSVTAAGINSNSNSNLRQLTQPTTSLHQKPTTSQSVENRMSSAGSQRSAAKLHSKSIHNFNLNDLIDAPENYAAVTVAALQQLQQLQQLHRRHSVSSRIPKNDDVQSSLDLLNKKSPPLEDASKSFLSINMNPELLQIKPELVPDDIIVNEEMDLDFSTNLKTPCPLEQENAGFGCGENSEIQSSPSAGNNNDNDNDHEDDDDDVISNNKNYGWNSQGKDSQSGNSSSQSVNSNNNDHENAVITASSEDATTTKLEVASSPLL